MDLIENNYLFLSLHLKIWEKNGDFRHLLEVMTFVLFITRFCIENLCNTKLSIGKNNSVISFL